MIHYLDHMVTAKPRQIDACSRSVGLSHIGCNNSIDTSRNELRGSSEGEGGENDKESDVLLVMLFWCQLRSSSSSDLLY